MAEVRPSRVDVIEPADGLVTHANDFEFEAGDPRPPRSARLRELLSGCERIDRPSLLFALEDHGGPEPICSHPGAMLASSTLCSVVLDTDQPSMCVVEGPPCSNSKTTWLDV